MSGADWAETGRLAGLRRFAIAISILNVLGHTVFGFEQAWTTPFVGLAAAYGTELMLEWVDARVSHRPARFAGGLGTLVNFLLSAHITGLAVGMLPYTNAGMWPVAFATAAAVASKSLFRVAAGKGSRHFFNPSNFGISLVLNARFTRRLPLITAWLSCFVLEGFLRHWLLAARLASALLPMTGVAFVLYTFYMVTDPATSPGGVALWAQSRLARRTVSGRPAAPAAVPVAAIP